MKNFSPDRTQHLVIFLKKAELLLKTGRKEFLRRLKKDLYISKKIDIIQWEVNTLYGAGSYEASKAELDRVMLYLQSLAWLWLECNNIFVMNENILFVFSTVDKMYFEFENAGKL